MAFANANISDILATTIASRTKKIADNVTNNNALLMKMKKKGRIKIAMQAGIQVTIFCL